MQKALIFNTQRYSLHDGPGIRTLIFFKGCSLRCVWCANPEGISKTPEIRYNKNLCIGCRKCLGCPSNATIHLKEEGFIINKSLCTDCGYCVEVCPSKAKSYWGDWKSVDEIVNKAKRDMAFFDASSGGITLSGGEPVLQWPAALDILKSIKREGINTAIETAGYYSIQNLLKLAPYLDTIFFDLKGFDPRIHKKLTSGNVDVIKSNLIELDKYISSSEHPIELIVRLPLLPEFNFRMEDMKGVGEFLSKLINLNHVEIMPFHNLGVSKYEQIDQPYLFKNMKNLRKEDVVEYVQELEKLGLKAAIVTW